MHRVILFIITSLWLNSLNSQSIAVFNEATQVLFIGAENPVTITIDKYKFSETGISVSTGFITPLAKQGSYLWSICESRDSIAYLTMVYKDKSTDSFRFRLMTISDPAIVVGPVRSYRASNYFKSTKGIRAEKPDFYIDSLKFIVLRYDVYFTRKDHHTYAQNSGAFYTDEVRKLVANSMPGDTVVIDNIWVQVGCEPRPRLISAPIVFNVY